MAHPAHAEPRTSRLDRALRVLSDRSTTEIAAVVWNRLTASDADLLPELTKDEEYGDVIVDLVDRESRRQVPGDLPKHVRAACARLLGKKTKDLGWAPAYSEAIGELCYLCARIDAVESLVGLTELIGNRKTADLLLSNGESVLQRGLRALIGLAGNHQDRARRERPALVKVLKNLLNEPGCELLALTGLVGLWPQEQTHFEGLLSPGFELDRRQLAMGLSVAGFAPKSASHRA